jgi:glycerol-3-phosphate dehydrogenase
MNAAWTAHIARHGTQFNEAELGRIAIIGGGAFGTALATVAARKGARARVWVRDVEQAKKVNETRRNEKYLPEFELHEGIVFTNSVREACDEAQLVLLALPTPFLRSFLVEHLRSFPDKVPICICAKGIELDSLEVPYVIAQSELPGRYGKNLSVLAGPSFAKEMMAGQPTNVIVSAEDPAVAFHAASLMSSRKAAFRCYASPDVIGAEVCGAVKNVLAIASGACEALKLGNNARSGMVCRGLAEMKRLALAMGSSGDCIGGLAGVGDTFLTCSSPLSRNFKVGLKVGAGEAIDVSGGGSANSTGGAGIAEGVLTARSIHELSGKLGVHMPICEAVFQVLYEKKPIAEAFAGLMQRPLSLE